MQAVEPITVAVPARQDATLADLFAELGFGEGNGDWVAREFTDFAVPWSGDQKVYLYLESGEPKCLHSLYSREAENQGHFFELPNAHGLFCIALELKKNPRPELEFFTGVLYAFGAARPVMREKVSHQTHRMVKLADVLTPVLYIEKGQPKSIYTMWHSGAVETSLVAFHEPAVIDG